MKKVKNGECEGFVTRFKSIKLCATVMIMVTFFVYMLNGTGGTYVYTSYTQAGAEAAVFNHTYLNSVVLAVAYIAAAVGISAAVVKKQSYK